MLNKASKAALSDVIDVLSESKATIRKIKCCDKVNEMRLRKTEHEIDDAIRKCSCLVGKEANILC